MTEFRRWMFRLMLCLILIPLCLIGCGGGGGSDGDGDSADNVPVTRTLSVTATVSFPSNSPLNYSNATVFNNTGAGPIAENNTAAVTLYPDRVTELSIFLPSRDGVEPPTLYLSTTIVPGEIDVTLDARQTAITLLLAGLNPKYLTDTTTASYSKYIMEQHADDFVAALTAALEDDPYLLRPDTIAAMLGTDLAASYNQAISEVDTILGQSFGVETIDTSQAPDRIQPMADGEEDIAYDVDLGNFIVKCDRNPPFEGVSLIPPNSWTSEDLTLVNGSMLPILTRITDTTSNVVLKSIPSDFTAQAFSPQVLTPVGGPFGLPLPNWETISTGNKNLLIEVFTPGIADLPNTYYTAADSPCQALLARAAFSSVLMPVIGMALPTLPWENGGMAQGAAELIFSTIVSSGAFENILYYWPRGQYQLGLTETFKAMSATGLATEIVNKLIEARYLDTKIAVELSARLGIKLIASEYALLSAGASIGGMAQGLARTPSKVSYHIIYPVGLHDLYPTHAGKLPADTVRENNTQEFTLSGHGFAPVDFEGATYSAELRLEAFNREGESLRAVVLNEDAASGYERRPCGTECTGDAIVFKLPDNMLSQEDEVAYVRVGLDHHYFQPGWMSDYTDWFNDLEPVELPLYDTAKRKFTIHLTQDVRINSISPRTATAGDALTISGEGFAAPGSAVTNEAIFVQYNPDNLISSYISSATETEIHTFVDDDIVLNGEEQAGMQHVGTAELYVELSDGSRSNSMLLPVLPKPVTFDPEPPVNDMTDRGSLITVNQPEDIPIFYSLDGGSPRPYFLPIEINTTTTITAYSELIVDGVIYRSEETEERYVNCTDNETYIRYPHGPKCVVIQNEALMPVRYCPMDESDYHGPIGVPFGTAYCGYYTFSGNLHSETHVAADGSTTLENTQFWEEPIGRPAFVNRSGTIYNFCPDGSFWPPGQSCSGD